MPVGVAMGRRLWSLHMPSVRFALVLLLVVIATALPARAAVTVAQARVLPEGTPVQTSGVVTGSFSGDSCTYIEDTDRCAGIRVAAYDASLAVGDVVQVSGTVSGYRPDGSNVVEPQITYATVTKLSTTAPLKPRGMSCLSVGGAALGPLLPGVVNGTGANNAGLLVHIAGRVTAIVSQYVYIDDGSRISDINGRVGVMVDWPAAPAIGVGDMVSVTGIVAGSRPVGWSANRRFIRTRSMSDIRSFSTGAIAGTVSDSTGAGIVGATVTTTPGGYAATSGSGGAYAIANVPTGSYGVTASKAGYDPRTQDNVVVSRGQTTTINLALLTTPFSGFVSNGDFERGFTSGVATGWSTWRGSWSNTITYSQETTDHLAGSAAQRWGRSDNKRIHGGVCLSVPTISGVIYEIIAWLRMDSADASSWLEAGVDLTGQTTNGDSAGINYTKLEAQGNRKWLRYRKVVKAAGSAISFFTKFGHYSETSGPNWAYVDNVSIQPRTVLEAEDYTTAYDTTSGNTGGAYRTGDVDIAAAPSGDGYVVGWTANGEWLEWSGVGSTGCDHVLVIDYSGWSDAVVHLSIDGTNVTGSLALPKSGWWDAYRRVIAPGAYWMAQGNHTVRLTIDTAGCNIDRVTLVPVTAGPFLEAENYSAYYDTTPGNSGGQYRSDGVDIGLGAEGYYVGWIAAGEWLEYPIAGDARTYVAVLRYASTSNCGANLQVNGYYVTGSVSLPSTGGSQTWRSVVTQPFTLSTGASTIRFYAETGGFNLNYIALIPLGDGGAGSDLFTGVHFAGSPSGGINDMANLRGAGQWIYSTEVYANGNREPEDPSFIANMTDWIVSYLRPMYQSRIRPIVRIDYIWGETIPRLLAGDQVDTAAVSRYVRTFSKFARLAEQNGVPLRHFVVANEMNLKAEATGFTNGYIPEWYYAYVYDAVRREVDTLGPGYEVLVGGLSPGTFTVDPIHTAPDPTSFYQVYSTDSLVYLDNVVQELKRRSTPGVGFALHAYNDFDSNRSYTTDFYWIIRKELEVIEKSHTVTPYGQSQPVTIGGYVTAPVYITEWNRHTPQSSAQGRVWQETQTSAFIRTAIERLTRFNRNREVYDNVSGVYRTYDHRDIRHNFHPVKAACWFVFDTLGGDWGDYSLKTWHTLSGSAEGVNDMYNVYATQIGARDPAGR